MLLCQHHSRCQYDPTCRHCRNFESLGSALSQARVQVEWLVSSNFPLAPLLWLRLWLLLAHISRLSRSELAVCLESLSCFRKFDSATKEAINIASWYLRSKSWYNEIISWELDTSPLTHLVEVLLTTPSSVNLCIILLILHNNILLELVTNFYLI